MIIRGIVIADLLKKAFQERGFSTLIDVNGDTGEGETACIRLNPVCKCISSYIIDMSVLQ